MPLCGFGDKLYDPAGSREIIPTGADVLRALITRVVGWCAGHAWLVVAFAAHERVAAIGVVELGLGVSVDHVVAVAVRRQVDDIVSGAGVDDGIDHGAVHAAAERDGVVGSCAGVDRQFGHRRQTRQCIA